jgi:hypothetical protein
MTLTATPQYIPINGGNSTINATVYYSDGQVRCYRCEFENPTGLGTLSSTWAWGSTSYPYQEVTLTSGSTTGVETVRAWVWEKKGDPNFDKTVTVVFTGQDTAPPTVLNPTVNPAVILNDNGRPRAAGSNVSRINVTVLDDGGVANVAINLSALGGSAAQPMALIAGTNMNGVWSVATTATTGINATSSLVVRARDFYDRTNTTVSVPLEVRRRGDVVRDNVVDMKDVLYIARYTVGLEPEVSNPPTALVADVVGNAGDPRGDGKVDMKDVLYLAKWLVGQEPLAP